MAGIDITTLTDEILESWIRGQVVPKLKYGFGLFNDSFTQALLDERERRNDELRVAEFFHQTQ